MESNGCHSLPRAYQHSGSEYGEIGSEFTGDADPLSVVTNRRRNTGKSDQSSKSESFCNRLKPLQVPEID